MEQAGPKHEKIRFRRDEIVRLGELPSANGQPQIVPEATRRFGALPVLGWGLAVVFLAACLVPLALLTFGVPGIAGDRIRSEAEAALTRLAGFDIDTRMGDPRLSIDPSRFLGLQVDDVLISDGERGASIVEAGSLNFGVRLLPLLSGKISLGSASIEDARISLAALPSVEGPGWVGRTLLGPEGMVEPELVVKAAFAAVHRAFAGLDAGSTRRIDFTNVEFVLPPGVPGGSVRVETARMERDGYGGFSFETSGAWGGRAFGVAGKAEREDAPGRPVSFSADLSLDPTRIERDLSAITDDAQFAISEYGGALRVTVTGKEVVDGPDQAGITAKLDDARVAFSGGDELTGSGSLVASFRPDARKIEIERAELLVGRSRFTAHGAIGPAPFADGQPAHYRYELVSDGSLLAPAGSSEPDVPLFARLAGSYDARSRRLTANEIAVRTQSGHVEGTAIVSFAPGLSPGVELALSVPEMSVSHAKQIWPWFAAYGAHKWANDKLFGGMIRDSRLAMSTPPGRFGDGRPLSAAEISGYFEISGARFDVTGQIPPVRDSVGTLGFQGTDVDIRLAAGTVFLPTGRTVAASNGSFEIRRGERPPVIGELDIDIAGAADAVAELAGYKPIDAMRHLEMAPEDLTGEVSGNVKARIPLQASVEMADLGWQVKLSYKGLSLAKPIAGQTVSDATGTIDVVPAVAVIKADAKLNGMTAKLDLSEPLGGSDASRRRDISLVMDAKSRNALAPGLESILTGPVSVKLTGEGKARVITADLADATLSIPWAGWSKGPGVPAQLAFAYDTVGSETRLSNIKLSSQSFSATGSATVTKNGLSSARFDQVRLNRADDFSIDIRRGGDGYTVSVKGNVLDARAVIKQSLAANDTRDAGGKAIPVTVEADLAYVSGFRDEALTNVKVSYRGSGSRMLGLSATGLTRSGDEFKVSDATRSGKRTVEMMSTNAGAVLRFLDIYPYMDGGRIKLELASGEGSPLRGQIEARDFTLVDEPRLRSIVASRPAGDTRTLNEAVRGDLDTSRVRFERGFARLEKGKGYLSIDNGVLRGPAIGTTFQGSLYDAKGNMAITGTFMPAYGLNRLFGEIPLLGQLLGNGRDRGLIGITYKVAGSAKSPQVQVNPISVIAPGIFRSIFEFN